MLHPRRREPNGQPQRARLPERERRQQEEAMAVALAQPHRKGERSPLAGYALGRLSLTGQISAEQFSAGERYTRLAVRHMRDVTGTLPRFPSVMADEIGRGLACNPDPEDDDVFALRRAWNDAMTALSDTHDFVGIVGLLAQVCIRDIDPKAGEIGSLRIALNALHRLWA